MILPRCSIGNSRIASRNPPYDSIIKQNLSHAKDGGFKKKSFDHIFEEME
jgi:hypothetical protein